MKTLLLGLLLLAACTKPNPNRCCTDEADCMAQGLPTDSQCSDGLLCRGGQCIAQACSTATECDLSAPYCVDSACAETCMGDEQCPGFQQGSTQPYCVSGACVACRADMPADCSSAAPVCDLGACRACRLHSECPSGVCTADGSCAQETEIAYVDQTGSSTSECTNATPCTTLARALALSPVRTFILINSGTYSASAALTFAGKRKLIGRGTSKPVITRSTAGPIVSFVGDVDATLESLQISGATTNGSDIGNGIFCTPGTGTPALTLKDVTVKQNASSGLAGGCTITALRSTFSQNAGYGVEIGNCTATFDACLVTENENGLHLDSGLFKITNNLIVRNYSPSNPSYGIDIYSTTPGNQVEFNTIVDNNDGVGGTVGAGLNCNLPNTTQSFASNIVARNKRQTVGSTCTHPNSIILDTDISALAFKSPDSQPFDYHLQAGSIAIDAATVSAIDHDVDGDKRPQGIGRDVGADEFVP
jgi:hypothetical protein